ncbi:MAG TPA: type II toxin-antitoxin system VapC family toxin [Candidatus Acidoferrum sp.]|nr:type II toxin-antitoxin system VapC family toxin [Candidatus Acidoferrum sp.]
MITPNDSKLAIVDSSGWVEYLGAGPKADSFARYLNFPDHLLLPSVIVYEVYKKIFREQGKNLADNFLSLAFGFEDRLISLDLELSILAARTSLDAHLPMADAIIYATAQHHNAQLVTSDAHFANLPGVVFL